MPSECATNTRVSSSTNGSMRARIFARRSGSVAMIVTMSTVRSKAASLAAWPSIAMVSPPISCSDSAIPARDCSNCSSSAVPGARRNRSP